MATNYYDMNPVIICDVSASVDVGGQSESGQSTRRYNVSKVTISRPTIGDYFEITSNTRENILFRTNCLASTTISEDIVPPMFVSGLHLHSDKNQIASPTLTKILIYRA